MAERTPGAAYRSYADSLQAVLGCITQRRLTVNDKSQLRAGTLYTLALADMDPVPLDGPGRLHFSAGQYFRIELVAGDRVRYKVTTTAYFYDFAIQQDGRFIGVLSFHWTPEAPDAGGITFPHLHIGPALLAKSLFIRSDDFHKIHIPTERVSLEAVVRLAITEFKVKARAGWDEILRDNEQQFKAQRTR